MEKILNIVKGIKTWQKYTIGAILFLFITIFSFMSTAPDGYETIYENLSETDKQAILVEFSKRGVDYKIDETGLILSVKNQDVAWVRSEMNAIGLPSGGKKGYELFAESGIGSTQKDKELNELTGRKGQIENEIVTNFSIIDKATVNFVLPKEKSIFDETEDTGTASVMISLGRGTTITGEQIIGIQHMVSSAIPGVESKNVTVIDSEKGVISTGEEASQTLSTAYEKQMEIKKKIELGITNDIKGTLSSLLGYENVQINVNAAINFDEIVRNIEQFDDAGVLRSKNGTKENTIKVDGEGITEAGLDANGDVPQYDVNTDEGSVRYQQAKEDIIENFEIGKTMETIKKSPELTNTNVLIVVDEMVMAEKGITAEQLREAIGIAAGMTYNPETTMFDNGQVSVLEGEFNKEIAEEVEVIEEDKSINWLYIMVGLGVLIAALITVIVILSRKKKKQMQKEILIKEANPVVHSEQNTLLTVGDDEAYENAERLQKEKMESLKDKEIRTQKEKLKQQQQQETVDEVNRISSEFPRETADYMKKLMNKR